MEFKVSLDQFEGPLDLMLHLISKQKLDLFDLDLLELARQYTDYIFESLHMGLDVASEYLVEFAGLLEYKSRKLLPRQSEELEDEYEEDPTENLAARLIAYQQAKEAAALLKALESDASLKLNRPADSHIEIWMKQTVFSGELSGTPYQLYKAMEKILRRKAVLDPYQAAVEVREISVESVMAEIEKDPFLEKATVKLEAFLDRSESLHHLIMSFLAVLELIHQSRLQLWMNGEEAWITRIV